MALLDHNLLPASFRGVPFAVISDELGGGRRIALHQYPGRDAPWAEDMGRAPRRFGFRGFIVDGDIVFAGGPILLQRALLLAALEKSGPGTLTHPTLGLLNVSVQRFSMGADLGAGRMAAIEIEFVESGKRSFPNILSSTSGLLSAATLCDVAIAADFVRAAVLASRAGNSNSTGRVTAAAFADRTTDLGHDATALNRLAAQLPGDYGRYSAGGTAGYLGTTASPYPDGTIVADLIVQASARRVAIGAAAAAVLLAVDVAGFADPDGAIAAAVTGLVAALLAACADPVDAVRLLIDLCGYGPMIPEATTPTGTAVATLFRRAAATALARATAAYQPSSHDDAFALLARVTVLLDGIATQAADAGDDASFRSLRAVRVKVVEDLRARGATLARVRRFAIGGALPALALAQRCYRDAARADQLIGQVAPISPLFMPAAFEALAA